MAKRRKSNRRSAPKRRSKRNNPGGANMKPAIDGFIAGVAPGLVQKFAGNILGNLTGAATLGAVAWWRKNPTLMTMAGYEAGRALGGGLGAATGGNGFFEE